MRRVFLLLGIIVSLAVSSTLVGATSQDAPSIATIGQTVAGWTRVAAGGATTCSDGTPYSFYVHQGRSDRLLLYFQGGGACWDLQSCLGLRPFDPTVDESDNPGVAGLDGVMDFTNPDNPFADYDVVFIPYCTGDFHTGSRTVTHELEAGPFTMHYQGATNAQAALNYAYSYFRTPESVFLTGCSAGAVGSAYHAPSVMSRYGDVPVVQMGDSAGAYRGDFSTIFTEWGLQGASRYEDLYINNAAATGRMFAQINTAADETQALFQELMGNDASSVRDILLGNLLDIHRTTANFRSYTSGDNIHCVTLFSDFYSMNVNGVRVRDWIAALAAGEDPGNVYFDGFQLWFDPPQ